MKSRGAALGGVSVAALLATAGLTAPPARAACDASAPASGATVTCDAIGSESDAIVAPGSTDVNVDFQANAVLQTATSPAINLGGGALIDMATGSLLADFDLGTVPVVISNVINGDFTGVTTQPDLVDLYDVIRAESPVRPAPVAATIELGATNPGATSTAASEIRTDVSIKKATLADYTMSAITELSDVIVIDPHPAPPTLRGGNVPAPGGANDVVLDGAGILSAGTAGIRSAADSALNVNMTDSALATLTENAPGILLDGAGALNVVLDNSTVSTFFDGAAGIDGSAPGTALSLQLLNGASVTTAGDNAAAILAPADSADVLLEARGPLGGDGLPMIATFGDNAAGFSMRGPGMSTVTIDIGNANAGAYGPGLQTSGNSSGLFDIGLGSTSSATLVGVFSSFGTFGDDSPVIGIDLGDNSDMLVFLQDTTVSSTGMNSSLLDVTRGGGSVVDFVSIGNIFQATGDGSGGIVFHVLGGDIASDNFVVADTEVSTAGADAAAFLLEDGGANSVRNVTILDSSFITGGANSAGVSIGSLVDNSVVDVTARNVTAGTTGADSTGLFVGGVGNGSATRGEFDTVTVTTQGENSHGVVLGEGWGDGVWIDLASVTRPTLSMTGVTATTSGANSHALVIGEGSTLSLAGQNHVGAMTANSTVVGGSIDTFDGFVATGAGSRAVHNDGTLFGTFTVGAAVVGNLANNGLIESADGAGSVAVQFTGTTDDIFELQTEGVVIGSVEAGAGMDQFILGGEGAASFDTALIGVQYNGFDALVKEDASTWTLTGANLATAPFLVNGGTLVNNANLANMEMTVASGARLEGIGTVGGLTINGTVAPGNSIGTLSVAGDVAFNPGSTYEVEVEAPDQADLISATGAAIINGGEVVVTKLSPEISYRDGQSYRIIEAGSVMRNSDFTFANPFLFLTSELDYGATYVDIVLAGGGLGGDFTSVAQTYNQVQAATGLNDLEQSGDGLAVFNELLFLTDASDARRAFDLASGEIHASGQHVIDQTFSLFKRTLRGQAVAGLGGNGGDGVFAAPLASGLATSGGEASAATAGRRIAHAWLAPLGGRGAMEGDGNAAELDWWTAGVAGGYEGPLDVARGNAWAGVGFGYMKSHGSVDARLSTMDADNFHIGIYGGWESGRSTLAGSLAYGASGIETERRILFGGIDRTAEADYWAHSIGFSGEAAHAFVVGAGMTLSPIATLDAAWSQHGSFTETGAGALDLAGSSENWTRLDTGFGAALAYTVPTGSGTVSFDARALWEHAFADVVPSQALAFAGSPSGFEVRGPDAGRDRLRLGTGVSLQMTDDLSIRARYDGLFSGDQSSHATTFGLNARF